MPEALRSLLGDCRRLLSQRGDANGPSIAQGVIAGLDPLSDESRLRFFDHLARD
jgi:malonyl-CoA decarboxylase